MRHPGIVVAVHQLESGVAITYSPGWGEVDRVITGLRFPKVKTGDLISVLYRDRYDEPDVRVARVRCTRKAAR